MRDILRRTWAVVTVLVGCALLVVAVLPSLDDHVVVARQVEPNPPPAIKPEEVDGKAELAKADQEYFALFETDTALSRAQFYTDKLHQRLLQAPYQGGKMPTTDAIYRWYFDQRKSWVGEAKKETNKVNRQPEAKPAT